MNIEDFMTRKLAYSTMSDSIQQAAKKMMEKDISSLVVVDMNNIPIGLVTERDIVRKACSREGFDSNALRVSEIMSSPLVTIDSKAASEEAAELFLKNKIRHLLVIDKSTGKAAGTVTPMDFTRYRENIRAKSQLGKSEEDAAIEKILDYYRE
jgi:signal-transduction protein with cAMP-binding, CBS, and nucleotidyltransferase domain